MPTSLTKVTGSMTGEDITGLSDTFDFGSYGPGGLSISGAGALDVTNGTLNFDGANMTASEIDGVIAISGSVTPPPPVSGNPSTTNSASGTISLKFEDVLTASTQVSVTFTSWFKGTGTGLVSGLTTAGYRLDVYPQGVVTDLAKITGAAGGGPTFGDGLTQTVTLQQNIPYVIDLSGVLKIAGVATAGDVITSNSADFTFGYTVTEVDSQGVAIPGNPDLSFDSGLTHLNIACFAAGSRIATPSGEVAVEDFRVGDLVLTRDGTSRPIVWIGQRTIALSGHPEPARVHPIHFRAGALGPDRPRRDLYLSPDHAVLIGEVLVPARYLINGGAIRQTGDRTTITYYHIELDEHDVVLAEGLPAESYLDSGDRAGFETVGLGVPRPLSAWMCHEAQGVLPRVVAGAALMAARQRVEGCSGAVAGW
jgi:Hint domain